jgi:hypothetical protein
MSIFGKERLSVSQPKFFTRQLKSAMSSQGGSDSLYTGAAAFGRVSAVVGGIFGTLIGIILIAVGVFFSLESTRLSQQLRARITSKTCSNDLCRLGVEYTPPSNGGGQPCQTTIVIGRSEAQDLRVGGTVTIFYDPRRPCQNPSLESRRVNIALGLILIFSGILIIVVVWFVVWLTQQYTFAAATEGVLTVIDLV